MCVCTMNQKTSYTDWIKRKSKSKIFGSFFCGLDVLYLIGKSLQQEVIAKCSES